MWRNLPTEKLRVILRVAKDPKKGLRPFFADPHEMIALREHCDRAPEVEHG